MFHYWLLTLFSAALLIFSFPGANLSFLAWFGLVPFFFLIQEVRTQKQLLLFSFLTGLFFYLGLLYWLLFVPPWSWEGWLVSASVVLGYVFLCSVLGIFFYFVAWPCWFLKQKKGFSFIWTMPVFWAAIEYIKTHLFTGFPWGFIGVSQYKVLPLIQIAEWTGVYGVSFLVVMGNAWIFEVLSAVQGKRKQLKFLEVSVPIVLLVVVLSYGFQFFYIPQKYNPLKEIGMISDTNETPLQVKKEFDPETSIKISLIQGNIPQDIKWSEAHVAYIHSEYKRLTEEAIEAERPDLVIWPETAMPSYLRFDHQGLTLLSGLIKKSKIPFLVGASDARQMTKNVTPNAAPTKAPIVEYYNTAFLIEPGKGFTQQYNKIHLVPFGEYMPWWISYLDSLSPLEDEYVQGKEYKVFDFKFPFSAVICYEDIFPDLVRRFVKNGATWLVNITNDGWFKNSSAPMQHNIHAVFRSVENRVWMVRCTNTGVSCFINPKGEIVSQIQDESGKNIWLPGWLTDTIDPKKEKTFYTQYGDVFSWLLFGVIGYLFLRLKEKK